MENIEEEGKYRPNQFQKIWSLFFRKRFNYEVFRHDDYLKQFGVVTDKKGKYKVKNKDLLETAYHRSWQNRDFEIDKFWTRAAYFWGFIVLIFGGYITVLTSEHNEKAIEYRLDLYLMILGFLFSIAWYLVILGSKRWQENWESHIDNLENFVSGPIYKTVHFRGDRFYSVSKINELMSILVLIVWFALYTQYYITNFIFFTEFNKIDFPATISLIITLGFVCSLRFGYAVGRYNSKDVGFLDRWS